MSPIYQSKKVGLYREGGCVLKGACLFYLDHFSHVALGAGVFGGIFNLYQNNKEQVVPHVVLLFDVFLKSHRFVVKLVPLQACRGAVKHIIYEVTAC